jgi:hypothetical protein
MSRYQVHTPSFNGREGDERKASRRIEVSVHRAGKGLYSGNRLEANRMARRRRVGNGEEKASNLGIARIVVSPLHAFVIIPPGICPIVSTTQFIPARSAPESERFRSFQSFRIDQNRIVLLEGGGVPEGGPKDRSILTYVFH